MDLLSPRQNDSTSEMSQSASTISMALTTEPAVAVAVVVGIIGGELGE